MNREGVLAKLFEQGEGLGLERVTLAALVEEASERGARRALGELGLSDPKARRDMDDLRELLGAWRHAKKSAGAAVLAWMVKVLLALVLVGAAVKLDLFGWIGG